MFNFKQLLSFKPEDLILDDEETIIVLKFIFAETDHELIDSLPMTDYLREFTQGLLVEAIDASYAVGYIHGLVRSAADPTKSGFKIIKGFASKAARHWFKHASVHDLQQVKIYDFVKNEIARRFKSKLKLFLAGTKVDKPIIANLIYKPPFCGVLKRCV